MGGKLTECDPSDPTSWGDDPAIDGTDSLIRLVFTPSQIGKDENGDEVRYTISPLAYTADRPGLSVELERLYSTKGATAQSRVTEKSAVGALRIAASSVRATSQKYKGDNKGNSKPADGAPLLKICFTPDQKPDRNDFHCDIHPEPTAGAQKILRKASSEAVELDQEAAAQLYAKKRGLGGG